MNIRHRALCTRGVEECTGFALALPCPALALALPWPCPGLALALPWPCLVGPGASASCFRDPHPQFTGSIRCPLPASRPPGGPLFLNDSLTQIELFGSRRCFSIGPDILWGPSGGSQRHLGGSLGLPGASWVHFGSVLGAFRGAFSLPEGPVAVCRRLSG